MTECKPIETLVRALRDKGVVLTLEGDCVQYRGPPRWCATDEMLELKARRDETIAHLESTRLLASSRAPAMQSRTSPLSRTPA